MKKFILLICLILQFNIYPQYDIGGVAPLQTGNYWIYGNYYGEKSTARVLDSMVVLDSNSYNVISGRVYWQDGSSNIGFGYHRLDSTSKFYIEYKPDLYKNNEGKHYKKDAQKFDTWTNEVTINPGIFYYKILDTGTTTWNRNITKIKTIEITDSILFYQLQLWSDDFGLIQVMDSEGASKFLVACVINGKVYGDTTFTDVKEITGNIPRRFSLSQNFPNPFNPMTKINFDLIETDLVTLKVYDILGNEVEVLVNEWKEAGSYTAQFTTSSAYGGKQLASGMYFYTLTAGNFTDTKKFILLK